MGQSLNTVYQAKSIPVTTIVTLGAIVLTFATLGHKSIWLDEAFSLWNASQSPSAIWSFTDPSPPGYYQLLHAWPWRSSGAALARLPSALAAGVSVWLTFVVTRRLWGESGAGWAAALTAWAPLHVWYAQEARMYAFVELSVLLMVLGLVMRSGVGFAVYGVGLTLGLYFHYETALAWALISAAWLGWWCVYNRRLWSLAAWAVASVAAAVFAFPLWTSITRVLAQANTQYSGRQISEFLGGWWPDPTSSLVALGVSVGVLTVIVARLLRLVGREPSARAAWVAILIFAALTLLAGTVPRFYFLKKIAIAVWPAAAIGVVGLAETLRGRARSALVMVTGLSIVATAWQVAFVPKDDWRGLVRDLGTVAEVEVDEVWLDPNSDALPFDHYRPVIRAVSGDRVSLEQAATGRGLLWLVASRRPGHVVPVSPSEAWLDDHRQLVTQRDFPRLTLKGYRRVPD